VNRYTVLNPLQRDEVLRRVVENDG